MSIFNIKQSFILYQTFGNIYTIAAFCKHALRVFHAITWLILLAHAQTNFPPVATWCFPYTYYRRRQSNLRKDMLISKVLHIFI